MQTLFIRVCVSKDEADQLLRGFQPTEEASTVHWFTLAHLLSRLPAGDNYLTSPATATQLAQVQDEDHYDVHLGTGKGTYRLWSPTVFHLMCLRDFVRFERFLQPVMCNHSLQGESTSCRGVFTSTHRK